MTKNSIALQSEKVYFLFVIIVFIVFPVSFFMGGCSKEKSPLLGKPIIFVGVEPLAFFVEQIVGDHFQVEVLVGPGQSPHTFEPSPQQVVALGRASLFCHVGLPFEESLIRKIKASQIPLQVVDLRGGSGEHCVELTKSSREHFKEDEIESGESHDHGGMDPHVWLSPKNMICLAEVVYQQVSQLDSLNKAEYEQRYQDLVDSIVSIDAELQEKLGPYAGRSFFVYHAAFGHFASHYHLHERAIEHGGKGPTPQQIKHLIEEARAADVRVIFTQPQFDSRSAKVISEAIDGKLIELNPLSRDVIGTVKRLGQSLIEAFGSAAIESSGKSEG